MGVHGLWTLLHPTGRPVTLESLDGKVIAVDVSIWLNQAIKGQRDRDGNAIVNPHLVTLFRRVCKLLHYRIRPVFVFDGAAPALKQRTLANRRLRKLEASNVSKKTNDLLLQNLLKQYAVGGVSGTARPAAGGDDQVPGPSTSGIPRLPAKRSANKMDDLFVLPPLPEPDKPVGDHDDGYNSDASSSSSSSWVAGETSLDGELRLLQEHQDAASLDPDSAEFRALPAEIQHELLVELRLNRKGRRSTDIEDLPASSDDFMSFQINKLMKNSRISNRIEDIRKELNAKISADVAQKFTKNKVASEVVTRKLASEDRSHVVLLKGLRPATVLEGEADDDGDGARLVEVMQRAAPTGHFIKCPTSADLEFARLSQAAGYGRREGGKDEEGDDKVTEKVDGNSDSDVDDMTAKDGGDLFDFEGDESKEPDGKKVKGTLEIDSDVEICEEISSTQDMVDAGSRLRLKRKCEKNSDFEDSIKNLKRQVMENVVVSSDDSDSDIAVMATKEPSDMAEKDVGLLNGAIDHSAKNNEVESDILNTQMDDKCEENGKLEVKPKVPISIENHGDVNADGKCECNAKSNEMGYECKDSMDSSNTTAKLSSKNPAQLETGDLKVERSSPSVEISTSSINADGLNNKKSETSNNKSSSIKTFGSQQNSRKHVLEEIKAKLAAQKAKLQAELAKEDSLIIGDDRSENSLRGSSITENKDFFGLSNSTEVFDIVSQTEIPPNAEVSKDSDMPTDTVVSQDTEIIKASNTIKTVKDINADNPVDEAPIEIKLAIPESPIDDELFPAEIFHKEPNANSNPDIEFSEEQEPENVEGSEENADSVWDLHRQYEAANSMREEVSETMRSVQVALEQERRALSQEHARQERAAATVTEQMAADAQRLLALFGVPFVVSPAEAEAQCAHLDATRQTDGSITDDSDVWLFGARRVYKNFFNQSKSVEFYTSETIRHQLMLTREKLVNLALLCGSDYTEGVAGVGPVAAMEIMAEFGGDGIDTLEQFKVWWSAVQDDPELVGSARLRKFRNLRLREGFPSATVVQAYLEPAVDESREAFSWGHPDLDLLRTFAQEKLGWPQSKADEMLVPMMKQLNKRDTQASITRFFTQRFAGEPVKSKSKRLQQTLDLMRAGGDHSLIELAQQTNSSTSNEAKQTQSSSKPARKPRAKAAATKGRSEVVVGEVDTGASLIEAAKQTMTKRQARGKAPTAATRSRTIQQIRPTSCPVARPRPSIPTELNLSESSSSEDSDSELLKAVEQAEEVQLSTERSHATATANRAFKKGKVTKRGRRK